MCLGNLGLGGFRLPWHFLALHVTQLHAATKSGEQVQEADVHHARHFVIGWKSGSGHTAKELALSFDACRGFDTSECAAPTAQARRAHLQAKIALKANDSLLCCTSNVMHLWHTAIIATAASVVHDDLGLINGVEVHSGLLWG